MDRFAVATNTPPFKDIRPSYPPRSSLKDVSFSSYLLPDTHASLEPPPSRLPHRIVVTADDAEISIFDAEKYYNGTADQKPQPSPPLNLVSIGEKCDFPRDDSVSSVDGFGRNYKTGSFHATPTALSEASWNSQSGLLSNPPGSIAVTMRNLHLDDAKKSPGSTRRWLFGRKCPCSGNKSVDVEEKFSQPRSQIPQNFDSNGHSNHRKQSLERDGAAAGTGRVEERYGEMAKLKIMAHHGWAKDEPIVRSPGGLSPELGRRVVSSARPFAEAGGFSFPILNSPSAATVRPPANSPEDPPRESLEVFSPPLLLAAEEMLLQRREAAASPPYPGEIGQRSFTFAASPRRSGEDDVASDSSSDLFEIESFSTGTIGGGASAPIYRRRNSLAELVRLSAGPPLYRHSLDDTSTTVTSVGPYEPSEASVEWSVVTAEGFDRGSLANFSASASEFGETTRFAVPAPLAGSEGGGKKKGAGGLLSCRCEKAVSIGPHPVKPGPDPLAQGRYPAETGRAAVIARLAANGGGLGHMGRSNSAPFGRAFVKR